MQIKGARSINQYSVAIDGIRAIAVLAVIINHFNSDILPSGYLGVDVFFVISGFVITNSMVKRNDGSLKLFMTSFYQRRIKRLLPALMFCFSITALLISFFSINPQPYIITGLCSLSGLANINLYIDAIDYWGLSAQYNPFTHTWSLGVEEQFYLIFPLSVWFIAKSNWNQHSLRKTSSFLVIVCTVSLLGYLIFHKSNPMMTYFLMPFRLWEIGFGCFLFIQLKLTNGEYLKSYLNKVTVFVPLFSLILIFLMPIEYKLINSLFIVFFSGILLLKIKIMEVKSEFEPLKVLTNGLMVYIGKLSYSLYLWHWVIITISWWTIGINSKTLLLQILLMLLISAFSYHFVEKPLRFNSWKSSIKSKLILVPMIVFILFFSITITFWSDNYLFLGKKSFETKIKTDLPQLNNLNTKCSTIRTLGNSHSVHIVPILKVITDKLDIDLIYQNNPDFIMIPSGGKSQLNKLDNALSSLNKNDLLILSSRNRYLYQHPYLNFTGDKWVDHSAEKKEKGYGLDRWIKELDIVIEKARVRGINVVLFLPNVEFDTKVFKADYSTPQWFRNSKNTNTVSMEYLKARFPADFYSEVSKRVNQNDNFFAFDPLPIYCSDAVECPNVKDDIILFNDPNHLTKEGALIMLNDFCDFLIKNKLI